MVKQLAFDTDARESLRRGVAKLARAVVSTLGPRGRNAILDKGWGGPTICGDGVTVAEEIELQNPFENMGAKLVREVASKTNDSAGDGTTTATLLAWSIFEEGLKHLTAGANPTQLTRGIRRASDLIVEELARMARKVPGTDDKAISQVATIAANNSPEIGKIIADAMAKVGKDGVITVEEGRSQETEVTVVEGMQFDRGFLSPHFVTNQEEMECELKDCLILIHEDKLSSVKKLLPILEKVKNANRPLLVIAEDVEGEALATMVVNKMRGTIRVCAVKAPGYGDRRKAMMQDIAIMTGATAVFKDLGIDLEKLDIKHLGQAKRIVVDADNTTIVEGGGSAAEVSARCKQIRREVEQTTSDYDKEKLQERLARLAGGIAVIRVGAATETEMKNKKYIVEDALHATRAAVEEGILPGGGVAFLRAAAVLDKEASGKGKDADFGVGVNIVKKAIGRPIKVIAENAGRDGTVVARKVLAGGEGKKGASFGYNALTDEYGDMFDWGIVDPTKVARTALQNAVSVATLLLNSDTIITEKPKKDKDAGGGEDDHHDDMDM